ncbi:MAG TPA: type II secretion system F family protein [Candidatus Saccharimonadia bacterium]|jgi:type IV pilus assembly protein PilC|nr:type II secretion system F family protein [Candidatus Saccharimonadia bacterium]
MQSFVYTAYKTESGENVKAEVSAENERSAAKLLMAQGLFPISIENKAESSLLAKSGFGTRISGKERVIFTRQLSTLINAGLPLTQSLRTVSEQIQNKALHDIVVAIVASVESGTSLSASFAKYPKVFSDVYVSLVAAGEASGSLDKALERIAMQQEKDAAIVGKIRGALIYPIIVLGVIAAVLVFMLTTVLPQVGGLYKDLHKPLPVLTQTLLAISSFITHFWFIVVIAAIGGFFVLRNYIQTESGRAIADNFKLHMPIFGRIYRKVYMARFARTLGTMLSSGIPMLEALRIVKNAIANVHVEAVIEKSMQGVKGGKALSSTLENNETFIRLVPQMIKIGEQSGAIDSMLDRVATYYENEVDEEVKNISTTIEPILMVVLGVTVGGVIAAILLPVYSLVGNGGVNALK